MGGKGGGKGGRREDGRRGRVGWGYGVILSRPKVRGLRALYCWGLFVLIVWFGHIAKVIPRGGLRGPIYK